MTGFGRPSKTRAVVATLVVGACLSSPAFADDLEGAYVGGAVGRSSVATTTAPFPGTDGTSASHFDATHVAYHLLFGVHPPAVPLALELEYLDLGEPQLPAYRGPGFVYGSVSQRGAGLFLLYYLPTPIVQVYAKAGGSRITTRDNIAVCGVDTCEPSGPSPTNTAFAFGAGLQWSLGRWGVRGEYERFNAGGGHPSLLSLGVTWTFL